MKGAFFCEACGAEVKDSAESCSACGRSFSGVRCPRCGREGSIEAFNNGCPGCGYLEENMKGATTLSDTAGPAVLEDWPVRRHYRDRPEWPACRYWISSAVVVAGVALILYFWLR